MKHLSAMVRAKFRDSAFEAGGQTIALRQCLPQYHTLWMDTVANVRMHESTHQRPIERFEAERAHLRRLKPAGFDLARVKTVRATKQFRVPLDSNHYTVPARYAGQRLTLKAYADRVCIYDQQQLIVRHARSMDRHKDIEDPEHESQLVAQRKSARE